MTIVAEEHISLRRASVSDDLAHITSEVNAGRAVLEPGLRPWSEETIARWLQDPSFANCKFVYFVYYGSERVGLLPCQRFADDLFLGDVYLRAQMRQPEPLEGMLAALLEQAVTEDIRELLIETGYPLSVPPRSLHSSGFRYKRTTYFVSRAPLPARILTPDIDQVTLATEPHESINGTRLRSLYDRVYRPSPSDWPEAPSAIEKRLRMAVEQTPLLVVARTPRKEVGYAFGKYDPGRRNFHIEEVAVEQEERGKQLSRMLMASIIEGARDLGAGSLSARVQSDNTVAVHLLRRLSFRTEKRWRVYAAIPRKAKKRSNVKLVVEHDTSELNPNERGGAPEEEVDLMSGEIGSVSAGLASARATLHRPTEKPLPSLSRKHREPALAVASGDDDEDDNGGDRVLTDGDEDAAIREATRKKKPKAKETPAPEPAAAPSKPTETKASTSKKKASTEKKKGSTSKKKASTSKKKASTSKKKGSTSKKKASTEKKKASTERKQPAPAKKASKLKKKAAALKTKPAPVKKASKNKKPLPTKKAVKKPAPAKKAAGKAAAAKKASTRPAAKGKLKAAARAKPKAATKAKPRPATKSKPKPATKAKPKAAAKSKSKPKPAAKAKRR